MGDLDLSHCRLPIAKIYEELSGEICQRTKGHKKRWLGINESLHQALSHYKRVCNGFTWDDIGIRINGVSLHQG